MKIILYQICLFVNSVLFKFLLGLRPKEVKQLISLAKRWNCPPSKIVLFSLQSLIEQAAISD